MKICYVAGIDYSNGYAPTTHPIEIVKYLSKTASISLVVQEYPLDIGSVSIYQVGRPSFPWGVLGYAIRTLRLLRKIVRTDNPDVFYARNSGSAILASCIGKRFHKPVICELNVLPDSGRYYKNQNTLKGYIASKYTPILLNLYLRIASKLVDYFVVVTENMAKALEQKYKISKSRIEIIPNGANTELFYPISSSEAKSELKLTGDINYICYEGILNYWQGVSKLISAAKQVVVEFPKTKFLIVGDGPAYDELQAYSTRQGLEDTVILVGRVAYNKVYLYINASELCVAPFTRKRNDSSGVSPIKIYEYGACGRAIVTSRISGLEFLEKYNMGLLVNPESVDELSQAIIKLLKNKELRQQMGQNANRYVSKYRSWEKAAQETRSVCQRVLDEYYCQKNGRLQSGGCW